MTAKNIGIWGGGNISETHLKAALEVEGLNVTGVCGQNAEKVKKLAELAGTRAFPDWEQFLDNARLDIVAIGSPSGLHSEQGMEAARRGIHVLVEKPIDINCRRTDKLIEQCARSGVKLGVFFQDRVAPEIQKMKALVDGGELGKLLLATAHVKWYRPPEYYSDSKWRGTWALDGGGAVINQAIHTLDTVLHLMGPVKRVFAITRTQFHQMEAEDTAVATFEFQNGAIGTFEAATSAFPGHPRRLFITGSEGTVALEHDRITAVDLRGATSESERVEDKGRNLSESSPVVSDVSGHRRIIEDFLEALDCGRRPLCDGIEGRRSIELVEAIYQSSRTGEAVVLESGQRSKGA